MLCCFVCTIETVSKVIETVGTDEVYRNPSQIFSSRNITQIWGYCHCTPGKLFLEISLKNFPKRPAQLVWKKGAFSQIQTALGTATLHSRK